MSDFSGEDQRTEDQKAKRCGCERVDIETALHDLFDEELDEARACALVADIQACPECYQRYLSEQTVRELIIRCCRAQVAPRTLHSRISAQIRITRYYG